MTKSEKCALDRHKTRSDGNEQRNEGDQVITPAAPYQKHEYEHEQRKQSDLIGCHGD